MTQTTPEALALRLHLGRVRVAAPAVSELRSDIGSALATG